MYEITFITKDEAENLTVESLIKDLSGKIVSKNIIGRKKFAYPIKKTTAGFYQTLYFQIDPSKLSEIEKKISINQEIIRYLLIKSEFNANKIKAKTKTKELQEDPATTKERTKEKETLEPVLEETKTIKKKTTKKIPAVKQKKIKPVIKKAKKDADTEISVEKNKKIESKAKKQPASETERLKKLEARLDELLKD